MRPQLCPSKIDPGCPQLSGRLRRLPVSEQDFVDAGEAAGVISAKEQILIFGPHDLRNRVAVTAKPLDASHPCRVGQIKSIPGPSADFGVGSAKGKKSDRMPFIPKDNRLGTGQVYVRIAVEEFDLAFEPRGVGDIILIHSREVLSSREVDPLVESGCQAQVPSILDNSDSVIRSAETCHAVVRRAVVDDNQLPIAERLELNGSKCLRQGRPGVVHGQDDADKWSRRHLERRSRRACAYRQSTSHQFTSIQPVALFTSYWSFFGRGARTILSGAAPSQAPHQLKVLLAMMKWRHCDMSHRSVISPVRPV